MIPSSLTGDIDSLIRRAQRHWLQNVCLILNTAPDSVDARCVIADLPATNNSDAAHCLANIIRRSEGVLSWKALGASIGICASLFSRWQGESNVELLWTGPSPDSQIPARRIDQVLYDLIGKRSVLTVFTPTM